MARVACCSLFPNGNEVVKEHERVHRAIPIKVVDDHNASGKKGAPPTVSDANKNNTDDAGKEKKKKEKDLNEEAYGKDDDKEDEGPGGTYDDETAHGTNETEQEKWSKKYPPK